MRHHFHRCMHLRVVSVPASELHGALRGGSVILEELCDARKLTPCLGLEECDILGPRQKQQLLVDRATRMREQEGRPGALSGVRSGRGKQLRQIRGDLVAERDGLVEESLRVEREIGGAEDRELAATRMDEAELEAAGVSVCADADLARIRVERLDEIDRALEAMKDPAYGTCALCGGEIELGRLVIYPETHVCTPCAKEAPAPRWLRATGRSP